jgi:hypothetical protein
MRRNKTYSFLLLVFWFFATHAVAQDSDRLISVSFEDLPLSNVLSYLTEHHSLQFSYSKEQIPLEKKISLILKDASVEELISAICEKADLEFQFIDGLVVMRRKTSGTSFHKKVNDFATVEGAVLDSASGKPLPFANVFFDNSSFGTTADSVGKFIIDRAPVELHRLVVSYLGYKTLIASVGLKPKGILQIIIKLQPVAKQLTDVVVTGKRDKEWSEDFEKFKAEILGRTTNARLCIIHNPGVVGLSRTKDASTFFSKNAQFVKTTNVFTAHMSEPLEIENRALGYRMKVLIEGFRSYPDSSSFLFYIHYDTLQATSESERFRWELNRLNAYSGSQMHFFRSVLHKQTEQEGFEICERNGTMWHAYPSGRISIQPNFEKISDISLDTSRLEPESRRQLTTISSGQYLVRYNRVLTHENDELPFLSSVIGIKNSLTIDASGFPVTASNYWRSGYFDQQRIADMLPKDYDEVKSRAKVLRYEAKKIGDIVIVVIDDATGKPIDGALAFINESTVKAHSNGTGKVLFRNVPLGSHEVVFFKAGYKLAHARLVSTIASRIDTIRIKEDQFTELDDMDYATRNLYLTKFEKLMLGHLLDHRRLENPYAINISRINQDSTRLWSLSPLKITDKILGFKINFFLDEGILTHYKKESENIGIRGYCYFEDLKGKKEDIGLEAKRLTAYDGSFLNFSRSLIDGRVAEEGFKLYVFENATLGKKRKRHEKNQKHELNLDSLKLNKDSAGLTLTIPSAIEIQYSLPNSGKTRTSTIVTNQNKIFITDYGIALPFKSWQVKGDMEEKGLLPKLPVNFKPYRGTLLSPF